MSFSLISEGKYWVTGTVLTDMKLNIFTIHFPKFNIKVKLSLSMSQINFWIAKHH